MQTESVTGDGFRFDAPADWTVSGPTARSGGVNLVEVRTFSLLKAYTSAVRERAARELDHATAKLAARAGAKIVARADVTVAGHDARSYRLDLGGKVEALTYVLVAKREYLLICRLPDGADSAPCDLLLKTFTLT